MTESVVFNNEILEEEFYFFRDNISGTKGQQQGEQTYIQTSTNDILEHSTAC